MLLQHCQIISFNKEIKVQEQIFANIRMKFRFSYHFFAASCAPLNMSWVCISDASACMPFPSVPLPLLWFVPNWCHLYDKVTHPSSLYQGTHSPERLLHCTRTTCLHAVSFTAGSFMCYSPFQFQSPAHCV